MTATLHTDHDRTTLRFERELSHGVDRVWQAVTDPDELVQWFPTAVVYEPRVGAPMQFDFGGQHGLDVWPGEVLAWEPPHVFAFAWGQDHLRFEIDGDDQRARLVFTHTFTHEPGKPARDASGWEACFEAFDALLGGHPGGMEPDAWARYQEAYLAQFGALTVDGVPVPLTGPYAEVDGRPAVNVSYDGGEGVMVVTDGALRDGAAVEIHAGSVAEPGEVLTTGTLHDPLAPARH